MRIFITGGGGLLGSKLAGMAQEQGHDVFSGYNRTMPENGVALKLDLAVDNSIQKAVDQAQPEIIFHTAALTDVDICEAERDLACRINARGTRALGEAAKKANAFLVYVSTDYIFDGLRGMYNEEEAPNPINYYGCTKLIGEKYADCIARTCVIYGSSAASGKINFALWILEKLQKGEEIRIVTDQFVSPTLNTNLAGMLLEAGEQKREGIYHLAGATRISRYDFACKIADVFGLERSLIIPAKMTDLSWKARRPMDSSMDVCKATRSFRELPWDVDKSLKTLKEEIS